MRTIPLTQGKSAMVDNEEYGRLMRFNWQALNDHGRGTWYAYRSAQGGKKVAMHRQILGLDDPANKVDHINFPELNS